MSEVMSNKCHWNVMNNKFYCNMMRNKCHSNMTNNHQCHIVTNNVTLSWIINIISVCRITNDVAMWWTINIVVIFPTKNVFMICYSTYGIHIVLWSYHGLIYTNIVSVVKHVQTWLTFVNMVKHGHKISVSQSSGFATWSMIANIII